MVAVQHDKLASAKDVERKRAYWAESLEKLKATVEAAPVRGQYLESSSTSVTWLAT